MLSINTNLSSLITQSSMKSSTNALNQAIERMTTGFKINHAKDNAANYSISTNMTTKLNAYDVAADNVANGMDLVTTAMDTISMMQDKAARLSALSTQARNGTYGAQSLSAINAEANAIMSEIVRIYNTSQYNGVDLFNRTAYTIASHLPQAGESGFIDETVLISTAAVGIAEGEVVGTTTEAPKAKAEYNGFIEDPKTYTDAEVAAMIKVADVSTFTSGEKYSISSVEELQKLADYVNAGNDTTGVEFVLGADIDLSSISNWTPIGGGYGNNSAFAFKGIFEGNGHVIKNLTIDNSLKSNQGLFGYTYNAVIINIGLNDVNIKGEMYTGGLAGSASSSTISNSYATGAVSGTSQVGGLTGSAYSSTISNSYATGAVSGTSQVGGLAGYANGSISNSYATGAVSGTSQVGGLAGYANGSISNSYATGNVTGTGNYVGGLAGSAYSTISNSYATGNVSGQSYVGGLAGYSSSINNSYATGAVSGSSSVGGLAGAAYSSISNSYATGAVSGTSQVGSLAGSASSSTISNSYATGAVSGTSQVGGLAGYANGSISNSYATGNVTGTGNYVGGLAGNSSSTISNSYATGAVTGTGNYVGGLAGYASSSISNSYAAGAVSGTSQVGGLAGSSYSTISNSYATGNVTGTGNSVGGLAGNSSSTISNSYATGAVSGTSQVGGLAGTSDSITNSYATGAVSGSSSVGGLAGYSSSINNSYATGAVSGESFVGGLLGQVNKPSGTATITDCTSYSTVTGDNYELTGSLVGGAVLTTDGTSYGTLDIAGCESISQEMNSIGGVYKYASSTYTLLTDYDMSIMLAGVEDVKIQQTATSLQVGINSDNSCQIGFDTNFSFDLSAIEAGIETEGAYNAINDFINQLSEKATMLGAVQNRLESALESIEVNINNLASSRSTIRDADIATESASYIQQQILQQAAATLMSTANQSPAIALQLI